ncbi:(2Fe-2S)-binding protein [Lutispora saccharofermentans]|uniref:(2Fe-2S)-binding protein n=1 Tax=Lutispora saccharofermentans TaxID=3024236 RepID=A0ABT1NCS4_9FIRM|nr:(2Fe-2S)-binding protein [Lutispora saccharofermentans]MCQ1529063.1 (2Fe-2S)-binding protein [Lutispora saccharofermentans]
MKHDISFTINGEQVHLEVEPNKTLLKMLREDLNLTGAKEGCGAGECGSCTVIVDGKAVNSCMMLAVEANGKDIITVEGLAKNGVLDPLQETFIKNAALQCGYCTPGMLMSAKALLMRNPNPSEDDIKEAIGGNLCRCTGYKMIIDAIKEAAGQIN